MDNSFYLSRFGSHSCVKGYLQFFQYLVSQVLGFVCQTITKKVVLRRLKLKTTNFVAVDFASQEKATILGFLQTPLYSSRLHLESQGSERGSQPLFILCSLNPPFFFGHMVQIRFAALLFFGTWSKSD